MRLSTEERTVTLANSITMLRNPSSDPGCNSQKNIHYNIISCLTFTVTRYLPPYTPRVNPLGPVTFKEAALFTCIRVHQTHECLHANLFFLHPFTPHVEPLDPVTCKEAPPLYWDYGSIRPTTGFAYPKS